MSQENEKQTKTIKAEKGQISVDTENLFPIIKKWLYSEEDIFLRELISNSFDAITKLNQLSDMGEYKGKLPNPLINIIIDKSKKSISIIDTGLGMTGDEIKKYINQIAFSGAKEFMKKYEQTNKDMIGHFGLGFFSSFMVADKVEIETLSYQKNATGVLWQCDGSTSFTIEPLNKKTDIGTVVRLHLNPQAAKIYLEEQKIKDLVKKHSNFLPVTIQVNGKKENEMLGLWAKKPSSLKKEDYQAFYKKLFPLEEESLFHIHLNVDYPFNLKGILYFPKIKTEIDLQTKGRIKLFCNHVFVSDNIIDIIPPYLNLLRGALDSPDIPLNVSRSFLKKDLKVEKIGKHIIKKIADKLNELFTKERKKYEGYFNNIHPFIKFTILSDTDFFDKIQKSFLFKTIKDQFLTLDELKEKNQTQKTFKDILIYTSHQDKQLPYITRYQDQVSDILVLDSPLDNHLIGQLEAKLSPIKFMRVDSNFHEGAPSPKDKKKEDPQEEKTLKEAFKLALENDNLNIEIKTDPKGTFALTFVQSEQMRRFSDMSSLMGNSSSTSFPLPKTLVINDHHPMIKKLSQTLKTTPSQTNKTEKTIPNKKESEKKEAEKKPSLSLSPSFKQAVLTLYDIALLEQNDLKGQNLENFTKRILGGLEKTF